ncbi:PhnD/SsuA/transferrin family substrate-binding protein [Alysiella filiformis]|uniref:Phosphonate transport system substrate-binding protein n=1 Tax=Alysiella filiformis DSM 16848 TaxID=1120981 RepID=A0A286E4S2_9NEIS|nr:PhnD/SsuA/transferrin family substrate-binding protein [Alysiella filiformis]QMT30467.1 PhnD/SsuA/transferrin family substrate-binding protein [Alysiella filiformis]UBQ56552.1 phosphate/phosphite/phosphonate ABC transporter substrate-binding protein [Alysiella filiformis DSM 16848]SOD65874.1 phosphonate transport system substrate-binding protein [Alysiella filiformis DSM 16848]
MLNFLIAPDFPPKNFIGWHMFNTCLQRRTSQPVHLLTPTDHLEQMEWLDSKTVDLIYANPFDATKLVREKGYLPVAIPVDKFDEVVIATHLNSPYQHSDELKAGCKIIATDNFDVRLIGLRLLESAGVHEQDINWVPASTFPVAARNLIDQQGDAAFFLASAYHSFNNMTHSQLRVLMESSLKELSHVVLLHPSQADSQALLQQAFADMINHPADKMALEDLGLEKGFRVLTEEDVEFMIDLIDTLK